MTFPADTRARSASRFADLLSVLLQEHVVSKTQHTTLSSIFRVSQLTESTSCQFTTMVLCTPSDYIDYMKRSVFDRFQTWPITHFLSTSKLPALRRPPSGSFPEPVSPPLHSDETPPSLLNWKDAVATRRRPSRNLPSCSHPSCIRPNAR